jgi:hypothetical protein
MAADCQADDEPWGYDTFDNVPHKDNGDDFSSMLDGTCARLQQAQAASSLRRIASMRKRLANIREELEAAAEV